LSEFTDIISYRILFVFGASNLLHHICLKYLFKIYKQNTANNHSFCVPGQARIMSRSTPLKLPLGGN